MELAGFPTFVKQALEKGGAIKFRMDWMGEPKLLEKGGAIKFKIDWMGKPKLFAHGVTWVAPSNYNSLNKFADMVKTAFGVNEGDYIGSDLRGDNYALNRVGMLAFRTSRGELSVELIKYIK